MRAGRSHGARQSRRGPPRPASREQEDATMDALSIERACFIAIKRGNSTPRSASRRRTRAPIPPTRRTPMSRFLEDYGDDPNGRRVDCRDRGAGHRRPRRADRPRLAGPRATSPRRTGRTPKAEAADRAAEHGHTAEYLMGNSDARRLSRGRPQRLGHSCRDVRNPTPLTAVSRDFSGPFALERPAPLAGPAVLA